VPTGPASAGNTIPKACPIIEVRVSELRQLFNAIDPSPFHERDLDLAFLGLSIAVGDAVASYLRESHLSGVLREGFLRGGWVAMWRPLEVFPHDWWPMRAEARLFDRLSAMPVRIEYSDALSPGASHSDSPATTGRVAPLRNEASP